MKRRAFLAAAAAGVAAVGLPAIGEAKPRVSKEVNWQWEKACACAIDHWTANSLRKGNVVLLRELEERTRDSVLFCLAAEDATAAGSEKAYRRLKDSVVVTAAIRGDMLTLTITSDAGRRGLYLPYLSEFTRPTTPDGFIVTRDR